MPWLDSYSFIGGPLAVLAVLGVLVVLLRWTFGGRRRSLVARQPAPGPENEYGLLVSIAAPGTYAEGEMLRRRLEERGIRATWPKPTAARASWCSPGTRNAPAPRSRKRE